MSPISRNAKSLDTMMQETANDNAGHVFSAAQFLSVRSLLTATTI